LVAAILLGLTQVASFDPGPMTGQPLPRFEAKDQDGRLRTFEDLKGRNGLVLVFFRSADW